MINEQFYPFSTQEWIYDLYNSDVLIENMTVEDREIFQFDILNVKWD